MFGRRLDCANAGARAAATAPIAPIVCKTSRRVQPAFFIPGDGNTYLRFAGRESTFEVLHVL